jgi:type IV secretory pathway TrbD component
MSGSHEGKDPEGFRVPIHASLTHHHLMAGIPRTLCIVIWTFVVALSMPLRSWYAIPLGFFFHGVAYAAAKRDPLFWDVFRRALKYRVLYRA